MINNYVLSNYFDARYHMFNNGQTLWKSSFFHLAMSSGKRLHLHSFYNNTDLYKAYSQKFVIANQFVSGKSRKYDVGNKSWFTVLTDTNGHIQVHLSFETLCSSQV